MRFGVPGAGIMPTPVFFVAGRRMKRLVFSAKVCYIIFFT